MKDPDIMETIAKQMEDEAEVLRAFRDAARRRGEAELASDYGARADAFVKAAQIIREHGGGPSADRA